MTAQIESKNLMILEDQATQEMTAAKKMDSYASQLSETQSRNIASQLAQRHKTHFGDLLNYLNSHQ